MFKIIISRFIFWLFAIIVGVVICLQYKYGFVTMDTKLFSLFIIIGFLILNLFIKGYLFNKRSLFLLGGVSLFIFISSLLYYFM